MTALELHRQHSSLDLAPILRVIKYMGFDSAALSEADVDKILHLYPHFEHDPELVVGLEAVGRLSDLAPARLTEILETHRRQIPFLGTTAHPMVPAAAIDMIRAVAAGENPFATNEEQLFTLTEMAEQTEISLASLSKYVKEHPERIPSRRVGKMRKFPRGAIAAFQEIKAENLGRRGNGQERTERQKAALSRRFAIKLAELESELESVVEVSKGLSRTLNRLTSQVRRVRTAAESGSRIADTQPTSRPRRSGGHRPDTIVAACKQILAASEGPMRVSEITERVIRMGTPINAKNPNVTVSSILSSYADFGRVKRGYYELLRRDSAAPASLEPEPANALIERDPQEVLAGLQAAADSEERGG